MNKSKIFQALLWTFLILCLTIGVPLLINWLYFLPPVIRTHWSAADILSYYGTLLGVVAGLITLFFTIRLGLWQLLTEYNLQREKEYWENIDNLFEQCFSDIHPSKLEMVLLTSLPGRNPYDLYAGTITFRITVVTSVDKLVSSIQNINDPELAKLKKQIISFRENLLSIEERYSILQQNTIIHANTCKKLFSRFKKNITFSTFAQEKIKISRALKDLYSSNYLDLLNKKAVFFECKYKEISEKRNNNPFRVFLINNVCK